MDLAGQSVRSEHLVTLEGAIVGFAKFSLVGKPLSDQNLHFLYMSPTCCALAVSANKIARRGKAIYESDLIIIL